MAGAASAYCGVWTDTSGSGASAKGTCSLVQVATNKIIYPEGGALTTAALLGIAIATLSMTF